MRVKLDEVDLDRYWRFALPVAVVGLGVSGALAVLVVTLPSPPDAAGPVFIGLLLAAFPVSVGTLLTDRRLGSRQAARDRERSVASWIVRSVATAAVFLAALRWHTLWDGAFDSWLPFAVLGLFHAAGIGAAVRYGRAAAALPAAGPGPAPTMTPDDLPPSWGAAEGGAVLPRGPWSYPDPPQPSRRERAAPVWRFLPPVVTAVAVGVFIATRPRTDTIVGDDDRPFYVGTVVAMDRASFVDQGLLLPSPPDPVWAAACRNYRDWLDDVTLNPDLVLVEDPALLRSAELLDGAYADDPVAVDAETFLVQEGSVAGAVLRMRDENWTEADVDRASAYYAAREDPPSATARDRYVIYTTSQTTSAGVIARLAVDPSHELTSKPVLTRTRYISVRFPDGSAVRIDESLCWD